MNILMIGSGGREHALIRKLLESPKCTKLYCAPGNGGISRDAETVNIGVMDKEAMVKFAKENAIDLAFVAPDDPLAREVIRWMNKTDVTNLPWNFTVFPSQHYKDDLGAALLKYAQGTMTWDEVKKLAVDEWKSEFGV